MPYPRFNIEHVSYASHADEIASVRRKVFVEEQQIAEALEFDSHDALYYYVLARDLNHCPIGTARLSPDGKIGRMAVLAPWRRQSVGRNLLQALVEKSRILGLSQLTAHAQITALDFYKSFGFTPEGEVFIEAGLAHQAIRMSLQYPAMAKNSCP